MYKMKTIHYKFRKRLDKINVIWYHNNIRNVHQQTDRKRYKL